MSNAAIAGAGTPSRQGATAAAAVHGLGDLASQYEAFLIGELTRVYCCKKNPRTSAGGDVGSTSALYPEIETKPLVKFCASSYACHELSFFVHTHQRDVYLWG